MQNTIDDGVGFTHCPTGMIHTRNHDLSVYNDFQELCRNFFFTIL